MAFTPTDEEQTNYKGFRIPILGFGLNGRLFSYDQMQSKGIEFSFKDIAGSLIDFLPKRKKKGAEPAPELGGTMGYKSDYFVPEKAQNVIDKMVYRMAREDANKVLPYIEASFWKTNEMAKESLGPVNYQTAAFEDGRKIVVANTHPDGRPMKYIEMAKAATHEKNGAMYTLSGRSHEKHHADVERQTEFDIKQYVSRAIREHSMN